MSNLRMRFLITVDGAEHSITTNARDLATVEKYLDPSMDEPDTMRTLRVVHAALMRVDASDVPSDFDDFVDLVDNLEPLDSEGKPIDMAQLNPTQPTA